MIDIYIVQIAEDSKRLEKESKSKEKKTGFSNFITDFIIRILCIKKK